MRKTIWKKTANILLCGVIGATILIAGCGDKKTEAVQPAAKVEQQLSSARNTPIVAAAKKVGPAVVGITNKAYVRDFFNRVELRERGTGSGVIYDKNGYIATNNHVIEGASEIIVSLPDGRTVKGKVLGADAATDLAVVKIDAKDLPVAVFGDSDTLQVGEPAIAIGNPLGLEFRGSVTAGVISALNRSIEIGERKFQLIQTDAAINPGNSGGALVNSEGKVIGINTLKLSGTGIEGMGFAIPINSTTDITSQLIQYSKVKRPYIGISGMDLNEQTAKANNLVVGVYVKSIEDFSAGEKAGIKIGDVIIEADGQKITKMDELNKIKNSHKIGDEMKIKVNRNGQEKDLTITLGEQP